MDTKQQHTLTVAEIYDLAILAGFLVSENVRPLGDEAETEITFGPCPPQGVFCETNRATCHPRLIAWLEEYPEEGVIALGNYPEELARAGTGKGVQGE